MDYRLDTPYYVPLRSKELREIEIHIKLEDDTTAVLPAEQTAARAESELKGEGIKPEDLVDAFQLKSGKLKRKVAQNKYEKKAKTIKKESTKKAKHSDIFGN